MSTEEIAPRAALAANVARFTREAAEARAVVEAARADYAELSVRAERAGPFARAENDAASRAVDALHRAEQAFYTADARRAWWADALAAYAPPDARVLTMHSIREAEYVAANARARERAVKLAALRGVLAAVDAAHPGGQLPRPWSEVRAYVLYADAHPEWPFVVEFVEDAKVDGVHASIPALVGHRVVIRLPPGHPCAPAGESPAPVDPSHPA